MYNYNVSMRKRKESIKKGKSKYRYSRKSHRTPPSQNHRYSQKKYKQSKSPSSRTPKKSNM